MVDFDIALGFGVEGYPARLEDSGSGVHIKKATPPSYSSVVSGKLPCAGPRAADA